MLRVLLLLVSLAVSTCLAVPAMAQGVVARVDPAASGIEGRARGFDLILQLSAPVPYRAATLADPPRLVLDFRGLELAGLRNADLGFSEAVGAVRFAVIQEGWARMVVDLTGPYAIDTAGMTTGAEGDARLAVAMRPVDPAVFAARSGPGTGIAEPTPPNGDAAAVDDGVFTVMLDPGHGGFDPGAIRDGQEEADIVLTFARELRAALEARGDMAVAMTRETDVFLSLDARLAAARRAGADVFLSLHADALAEGAARGAQVYTLAREASSAATRRLAERHDRADLLAGVDLRGRDDEVARVLMSMARTDTAPRSEALAEALVAGFAREGVALHKRPREWAAFSVLRSPDIPSALIELGFMSDAGELAKLQDPAWRARAVAAIVGALERWAEADSQTAPLRRQ